MLPAAGAPVPDSCFSPAITRDTAGIGAQHGPATPGELNWFGAAARE